MLTEKNKPIPIKIDYPTFFFTIPSSKKEVKLRGYTVGEEKMLLIGMESKDWKELLNAFKQIIVNCSFQQINPADLTTYDLEALFLALKARSSGETVTISLRKNACPLNDGLSECAKPSNMKVNLKDVKLTVVRDGEVVPLDYASEVKSELQVMLSDTVGIKIRHPHFNDLDVAKNLSKENATLDDVGLELMAHCITDFFDAENVYPASEYSTEDKIKFLKDLDKESMKRIDEFYLSIPKMRHTCKFICSHCDVREDYKIEGLSDFFA